MAARRRPADPQPPDPGCFLAHLRDGQIAISADEHARLVQCATAAGELVRAAVERERQQQLEIRSDLLTAHGEQAERASSLLAAQLTELRAELKDRGEQIRQLLTERHADVALLGQANERAVRAEQRDARIAAEDMADLRRRQLDLASAHLNHELWTLGISQVSRTLAAVAPMIAARSASSATSAPALDLETDPPALSSALCQLLWRVRDPELVEQLRRALAILSTHPQLEALGLAIAREAPEAFAAVAAIVQQPPDSEATQSTPQTIMANGATNPAHERHD